jgi:Hsp70 protein
MNTRPLYVGIDLGTSNSTVVLFDGKDLAVVRNRQGGVLTPSIVRIDGRGNVLVGDRAQRFLDVDPEMRSGTSRPHAAATWTPASRRAASSWTSMPCWPRSKPTRPGRSSGNTSSATSQWR